MPEPEPSTRDKLIDAAARLFAERGIDSVCATPDRARIGQRNASAVSYQLRRAATICLLAPLERYVPVPARARLRLAASGRGNVGFRSPRRGRGNCAPGYRARATRLDGERDTCRSDPSSLARSIERRAACARVAQDRRIRSDDVVGETVSAPARGDLGRAQPPHVSGSYRSAPRPNRARQLDQLSARAIAKEVMPTTGSSTTSSTCCSAR